MRQCTLSAGTRTEGMVDMMVAVFIWFGFLSCVEAPQSTTKPPSEIVNDTEVGVMDTKKSVPITMALRIPRDVRVELIDGIAVEYSCNMFIRLMAVQREH